MSYRNNCITLILLVLSLLTTSINAAGFIKKEVYSYKDSKGNLVFTDKKPMMNNTFKTQVIESANSTGNTQKSKLQPNNDTNKNYKNSTQTVRIIVDDKSSSKKNNSVKKKNSKRCKSYKKKFDYYSDKMKSGYKNSEYEELESNRKKYRNLLFNDCETKTFSD